MNNVIEYSAAPSPDSFREVTSAELAAIINDIRLCEHTASTDGARANWQTDIGAATLAAEFMDAFAHRVFVAQDEDGYYFATEENQKPDGASLGLRMKELTGSDKQIAWASDIRRKFFADNDDLTAVEVTRDGTEKQISASAELSALTEIDSAKFWIDTRQMSGFHLMAIARGILQGETWQAAVRDLR